MTLPGAFGTALLAAVLVSGCAVSTDVPVLRDTFDLSAGGGTVTAFTIDSPQTVSYETHGSGTYSVCIVRGEDAGAWLDRENVTGWACHEDASDRVVDSAFLESGAYGFGVRCENSLLRCSVTAKVSRE